MVREEFTDMEGTDMEGTGMAYAEMTNEKDVLEFINAVREEKGEDYTDGLIDELYGLLDDIPWRRVARRELLGLFQELRPKRCGKVNIEDGEVVYNEEKYTEWRSNFALCEIHDLLYLFDYVGLDYELRLANHYDPRGMFTIFIPDDEKEVKKFWMSTDIHSEVNDKYREIMREAGIETDFRNDIYWGCEIELCPEKYTEDNRLVTFEEYESIVKDCYEELNRPKVPEVFELEFEKRTDEYGNERKYCKAILDEKNLNSCRKEGFSLQNIDIPPESFSVKPISVEEREGVKIYTLEFPM